MSEEEINYLITAQKQLDACNTKNKEISQYIVKAYDKINTVLNLTNDCSE